MGLYSLSDLTENMAHGELYCFLVQSETPVLVRPQPPSLPGHNETGCHYQHSLKDSKETFA